MSLRDARTIRARCRAILDHVAAGASPHFRLDRAKLDAVADLVARVTRESYPDLRVPYHSRWRHFEVGDLDRWAALRPDSMAADDRGRMAYDLVVPSVLLDAGAGPAWSFEEDGRVFSRSEGLAVATFHMFVDGLFSADSNASPRADGARLARLSAEELGEAFQANVRNPLVGLEGRAALMRALGQAVLARPEIFRGRLGGLFDHLFAQARGGRLPARHVGLQKIRELLGRMRRHHLKAGLQQALLHRRRIHDGDQFLVQPIEIGRAHV